MKRNHATKRARLNIPRSALIRNRYQGRIASLPLVTISLTSHCNCRCIMCHYWQNEPVDFPTTNLDALDEDLTRLDCRVIGLTGGEPLLHPDFKHIIRTLKHPKRQLLLMTNGTLIPTIFDPDLFSLCDSFFISLDGPDRETHERFRGPDSYTPMVQGVHLLKKHLPEHITVARCTLHRFNWLECAKLVHHAEELGFDYISFVAVDTQSQAYGRDRSRVEAAPCLIDQKQSSLEYQHIIERMISELGPFFRRGFIQESPSKLREIVQEVVFGSQGHKKRVKCNTPLFSVFINERAEVLPCFFRPVVMRLEHGRLLPQLFSPELFERLQIKDRVYADYCQKCTCPFYRSWW
ncbi:radical SAM protein [bacterium]|nr:radical SAM protein [bacterium]